MQVMPVVVCSFAVVGLSLGVTADAQSVPLVAVSGIAVDSTGALIPGASVRVSGDGQEQTSVTDRSGHFALRLLPGEYDVRIEASGFQPYLQPHLQVTGDQPLLLRITLQVATAVQEVDVPSDPGLSTDSSANKTAMVFKGEQLDTFSDDPAVMQQQLLAMGGADPSAPAQIYVDGFSNGTMPPKDTIREVHINESPITAQSDQFGRGRIEVFTKPGSNKLHGNLEFNYGNSSWNARNPYTGAQPPYSNDFAVASLDGPLGKKTSFFLSALRSDLSQNAVVNAVTLDGSLNPVTLSQPVANEVTSQTYSGRVDRQFGANDTLIGRYTFANTAQPDAGTGLLVLPSEGYRDATRTQTLQLSETHLFGPKLVSDAGLQYIRTRRREDPMSHDPTLVVQGAFSGGGSPSQALHDNQDRLEVQEYLTLEHGKHLIRTGVRYRLLREANLATAGFNGSFVFPDIDTYRSTLLDLQNGLSPAAIRAKGDGATQFSLSAGTPSASLLTGDVGVYAEDEWKARPELTFTLGLRLESQSAIPDHFDVGPRVGFAYALKLHKTAKQPFVLVRGGFGIFYKRFAATDILTSLREDGVREQVYFVQNPDFFPNVPLASGLTAMPSTVYRINPRLHTPVQLQGVLSGEHQFGKWGDLSVSYFPRRQFHELESLNLNAPMPGTGVRPYGGPQNVYEYSSDGISKGQDLTMGGTLNLTKKLTVWTFFSTGRDQTDTAGADSFASNSYNLGADFADYNGYAPRQLYLGANSNPGWGTSLSLFLVARSHANFDITTGQDNNGDSIYNDRPAFATDLSRPSVVRTAFGDFDTDPLPTQTIIPHNYGRAPDFFYMELYCRKEFQFGPRHAVAAAAGQGTGAAAKPGEKPPAPYRFQVGIGADNLLNRNNPGAPVGVLTSPFFGRPISLNAPFTGNTAANRALTLRGAFSF